MTDGTFLVWCYPTDNTVRQGLVYHIGGGGGTGEYYLEWQGQQVAKNFDVARMRGTQYSLARADAANFANFATSKWNFIAGAFDTVNTTGNKLLIGDLTHAAAEPSAYTIQRTGSGAASTSNGDCYIGVHSNTTFEFHGEIAFVGVWNRVLSNAEIIQQQWRPRITSGCVLFTFPGLYGTGSQPDFSGNATSGTITGAAASSIAFPQH
jgi:hypothetical protein